MLPRIIDKKWQKIKLTQTILIKNFVWNNKKNILFSHYINLFLTKEDDIKNLLHLRSYKNNLETQTYIYLFIYNSPEMDSSIGNSKSILYLFIMDSFSGSVSFSVGL